MYSSISLTAKKISVTPDEHKIPVRGNSIKYHNTEGMIVW